MRGLILLAIVFGLLLVGASQLTAVIADPELNLPPSGPFYAYLLAILFFSPLVIEHEQPGYFRDLVQRLRSFSLPSPAQRKPKTPANSKPAQRSSGATSRESKRLRNRITELEKENAELKAIYSELSVELRKLKRKSK